MKNNLPKPLRLLMTLTLIAAVVLISFYSFYRIWETPPAKSAAPLEARAAAPREETPSPAPTVSPTPEPEDEAGIYTLLLVGNDDGNGNTDTILLCRLDTGAHTLRFLSIPRDTLINADWEVRKVNAVYWGDRLSGGNGIDALRRHIRMLTGITPDNYAVLDIEDLIAAVDLLGGVDFEVPMPMHYDDPSQNLHIHLDAGMQHLNGEQVMGVCRYRSSYVMGDIGRIEMQQQFLRACLEQFTALGKVPNLVQAAEYLANAVDTDLTAANMAWYARQALSCDVSALRFETLPTEAATVHKYSYAVVRLWDWLPMLNELFNPYEREITADDLDLVYRGDQGYVGTQGLRGSWYYGWAAPAAVIESPAPTPEAGPRIASITIKREQ